MGCVAMGEEWQRRVMKAGKKKVQKGYLRNEYTTKICVHTPHTHTHRVHLGFFLLDQEQNKAGQEQAIAKNNKDGENKPCKVIRSCHGLMRRGGGEGRGVQKIKNLSGVHTHAHTYIQAYIHTYIHIHIHTHMHTHTHIHIFTYIRTHAHTYTHTYIYIYTYTCTHIHTYIYLHIYVHMHTHTHIITHAKTHTYIYTYMYRASVCSNLLHLRWIHYCVVKGD